MTEPDIEAAAQYLNRLRSSAQSGARLAPPLRPLRNEDAWRIQRRAGQLRGQMVAHQAVLRALGLKLKDYPFSHASDYRLPNGRPPIRSASPRD